MAWGSGVFDVLHYLSESVSDVFVKCEVRTTLSIVVATVDCVYELEDGYIRLMLEGLHSWSALCHLADACR